MNSYLEGTLVTVATYSGSIANPLGGFRDENGLLTDPSTVTLKYAPAGSAEVVVMYPNAPIVKDGEGLYHANLDSTGSAPTDPVIWSYEWLGTGTVQAVAQAQFEITPPYLP